MLSGKHVISMIMPASDRNCARSGDEGSCQIVCRIWCLMRIRGSPTLDCMVLVWQGCSQCTSYWDTVHMHLITK